MGNRFPLIVTEVLVDRPLPAPNAEPLAVKLAAPILSSDILNPIPVTVLQHFVGEPGWVILWNSGDMTRPLKHKPMIPHVPIDKSVCSFDEFDFGIGADHVFLFRLLRLRTVAKHLL